jgi:collagen beta-1,O-galactosyltransferase
MPMNVFVVNLARRPDRRARMERTLPHTWNVEYTTGWPGPLDGAAIEPGDLHGFGLFPWEIDSRNPWWNRPLKLGEIGCAVSHLLCWRQAAELNAEITMVLEDDVSLSAGIEHELDVRLAGLRAIDPAWDLVYLGRWALEPDADTPVGTGLVRPGYSYCTFGYLLSAAGLAKLEAVGFERDIIPVDELLPALYMPHPRRDVRRRYPPRLSAYAFEPPLVIQLPKDRAGSDTEATVLVELPT